MATTQAIEATDLWVSLIHAHALIADAIEDRLQAGYGIGLPGFEVLMFLHEAPEEGKRMQELARAALLTRSGLTRLVDRLEVAGLVRRASCASDRRGTLTAITSAGRKLVGKARVDVQDAIEDHFTSHLTAEQRRVVYQALSRVLAANDHEIPTPCEILRD
jgi:DNA-binding MarR family transcriptional regulator